MTIRPAIIGAVADGIESFIRTVVSEMIAALVRGEQNIAEPLQADCISKSTCKLSPGAAVRIHFHDARTNPLFLFARIAARADRNIKFAIRTERDRTRKMPAAVLVVEPVIGKRRERLRIRIARLFFSAYKLSSRQLIGLGKIEPILAILVTIELRAVRILQPGHVRNDLCE